MIAAARLALSLANWHAMYARHLPERMEDVRQCGRAAVRPMQAALTGGRS